MQKPMKANDNKEDEFKEGQRWENPDGLCMCITVVKNGYVHYLTDEQEMGKQTIHQMRDWKTNGAITPAAPQ